MLSLRIVRFCVNFLLRKQVGVFGGFLEAEYYLVSIYFRGISEAEFSLTMGLAMLLVKMFHF